MIKTALKEPLVHFLLAGIALFFILGDDGGGVDPADRSITIDKAIIDNLAGNWQQTWRRPPTEKELDGLIHDYIKEEIYYREALRLGLDDNDTVIRRRLRNKMEFIARSEVENAAVDDTTLQKWLDENEAQYSNGATLNFEQIYLGNDEPAAKIKLQQLNRGVSPEKLAVSLNVAAKMEQAEKAQMSRIFGEKFANDMMNRQKSDDWQGLIPSGFGFHAVKITAITKGQKPKLADIRQRVENDWRAATAAGREARAYQALLDGYAINLEKP